MRTLGMCTALLLVVLPCVAQPFCAGDCDGDGVVTLAEFHYVVRCLTSPILPPLPGECVECADADGDGAVSLNELIAIVNNVIAGCPGGPTPTPIDGPFCLGDCNGDRRVTVAELTLGTLIALGSASVDACPNFAPCSPGLVCIDISVLQSAIDNALRGCP